MTDLTDLIQHSSLVWLMATGLLLGGLHALEPGHAKTMMASFIVATRGTARQAALLGVSAALSHSVLIWVLAAIALYTGNAFIGDDAEPWLQFGSGVLIAAIGVSMAWRHMQTRTVVVTSVDAHDHEHHHDDDHDHGHHHHPGSHDHGSLTVDAHTRAHARQLEKTLASGPVTTRQIILFGFSGGLMPCPAALTMLLVCLRLKKVALGVGLVTSFSVGLAIVLVALGVVASIGVRHASRHLPRFERVAEWLPYVSSLIVVAVGVFMAVSGYRHLA